MIEALWHLASCTCLICFKTMISNSTCVAANDRILLIFYDNRIMNMCLVFVSWWALGWVHFCPVVNRTAVNMECNWLFDKLISFPMVITSAGIVGSYGRSFYFMKDSILFSIIAILIYISTISVEGTFSSLPHQHLSFLFVCLGQGLTM